MISRKVKLSLVAVSCILSILLPRPASAIPQFARRYHVTCYACHTIPPVLNQQGYMFMKMGHHLPPALEALQPAPKVHEVVEKEPQWTLANNASLAVADFGINAERDKAQSVVGGPASSSSTSAFQVNFWNAYFAGWIPDTSFFYYSEFDIVTNGQVTSTLDMPNAHVGYMWGTASRSWYAMIGREHLQVAQGTRASQVYSLLPVSPLVFEQASPTNFVLDQSPVGMDAGVTFVTPSYKRIFAMNARITNGVNPDGSEALTAGTNGRNGKDAWVDADFWYAPESAVSFMSYQGRKLQTQNVGLPNAFTFSTHIARYGVFGNYMVAREKVDLLAGYVHAHDDWEDPTTAAPGVFISNGFFTEIDYYILRGFALAGRYDRLKEELPGVTTRTEQWQIGVEKALSSSGNIIGRLAGGNLHRIDPVSLLGSSTRTIEADIQFSF